MQISKILHTGLLCLLTYSSWAQQTRCGLTGTIRSEEGQVLPGASVSLANTNRGTFADHKGTYQLNNLPAGRHTVVVSFVGYQKISRVVHLKEDELTKLNVELKPGANQLATVAVIGRTEVQEVNRQAFNVTAIDAKQLYNSTLDLSSALDRVSGVRVRESGGVGSNFNLSLNGFSGNRIRYFIDGVPMDNFGSSFQINNIPINTAERLEVYKGVVPIWLGSDALGGAINIVTGDRNRNYVDASYSIGSFNTHRTSINAAATSKSGLTAQINAFQNYSDNDYKVKVDAADINTGAYAPDTWVRRFHDNYHNETLIANVG
ncbi:MAG: PEGA domain-containing protein, partial [Cytophagaceae bacterium]